MRTPVFPLHSVDEETEPPGEAPCSGLQSWGWEERVAGTAWGRGVCETQALPPGDVSLLMPPWNGDPDPRLQGNAGFVEG